MTAVVRAGLIVSVLHDVDSGLAPPVEHDHHQHMPELVTGSKIVQLACEDRYKKWGKYLFWQCINVIL